MTDIRQKVSEVLDEIGLPYGYVSKDEGETPFIAYNISNNSGYKFYDDEESVTQYKITINIFSTTDYTDIQKLVEEKMKNAGFTKDYYPACLYTENMGVYIQPMFFNYYEEGEN